MDPVISISLIGIFMMLGGLLFSKKVADTMSFEITSMNAGQGFTANFVTSIVVIFASKFGMPVSTTHVSCGALFGIGTITKKARWQGIFKIFMSWVFTLPVAVLLGCLFFLILKGFNL
jgi:PiT family inorganic phosphate transporter